MAADHGALISVQPVPVDEVRPLRHRVLRPGQDFAETVYPGDDLADTVHLGAFDDVGRVVGIASLYREARPGGPAAGWRLRGMATDPGVRGAGFGAALLADCVERVAAAGGEELWCNARASAVGFYRGAAFVVVSEPFEVPGIGTHVVMAHAFPAAAAR